MINQNSITFTVWEGDPHLKILLEPEAFILTVNPGEELTFSVKNASLGFSWTIRHERDYIQLFPATLGRNGRIEIFRNGSSSSELDF
ncbi:hypothetical protein [Sporocytophaga myxococcoides]|uniref:hypothetical protein n=1 Tax=Sporocytophaga myxococcoides TaxID=153721 RepID=UPI0012DC65F5|nr:hypothetical protein [Sporocytophaga myxococcoides]